MFARRLHPSDLGGPVRSWFGLLCVLLLLSPARAQDNPFSNPPVWSASQLASTQSVALGDVDRDGDLDLVCGNFSEATTLHLNVGGTFGTDPVWTSGTADNTNSVALGDVDGDGWLDLVCGNFGRRTVLFRNLGGIFAPTPAWSSPAPARTTSVALGDVDGDGDLDLVCGNDRESTALYANEGGDLGASPVWLGESAAITRSVALGDVDRDGDLDLVCGNSFQRTTLYRNDTGRLGTEPIWRSGPIAATRSVALGDVDGDGLLDLVCGNEDESTTLFRGDGAAFGAAPAWASGATARTQSVVLADLDRDGDLDLATGNHGPTLIYRNTGTALGSVPAWSVHPPATTSSIAVGEVHGDGDLDLVSGNAYERATLHLAVPPGRIKIVPLPGSSAGFPSGQPVRVQLLLAADGVFLLGILHYRPAGAPADLTVPLQVSRPALVPMATIPAIAVADRSVQYWAEALTLQGSATDPPERAASTPHSFEVAGANLVERGEHPGGRYRLLSIPAAFDLQPSVSLEALLADQSGFGPYDPRRWRVFRYLPELQSNVEYSAGDLAFHPRPGRAFWLISLDSHRIDTAPVQARSTSARGPYPIVLQPGWNAAGNPFGFPVAWAVVRAPAGIGPPIAFDSSLGTIGDYSPDAPSILEPFAGFFIENTSTDVETLWVPPVEAVEPASPVTTCTDWSALLQARTSAAFDGSNLLGVDPRAGDELDALDGRKPPPPPGPWVQLAFANHHWRRAPGLYGRDVRPPSPAGHAWAVEVRSARPCERITLELAARLPLPADLAVRLLDPELGTAVDLLRPGAPGATYSILSRGPEPPCRLVLLAGTPAWVAGESRGTGVPPGDLVLDPSVPNPFNAVTRIRFGLPHPEAVTLDIVDVRGARLASLVDNSPLPAGYHAVIWDGRDGRRHRVASGVYFCRLSAGTRTASRRLVLLQ